MPITATYSPGAFTLAVTGTNIGETMTIERDVAGALLVNGGTVPITGGSATVANTDLITASGGDGNDIIALNEANGALPKAELSGGNGDDTLTGGSGNDLLTGEANNDVLAGRGGADELRGGADNDTLTGGDGDDQMFGDAGDDRMIWNPGDDSDLMEGGDGTDTAEVNGGGGAEVFTVTANGARVRFDRLDPAPFALDLGTTERLELDAGDGNDSISATGNLAALISLTLDGGGGNDTILGSNGIDTLMGGDGDDFIDGQQGNDVALLGAGADTFQWDPGDGSDVIEGQGDFDRLLFNGSAANEILELSANGARALFTRNIANIVMDLNDLERVSVNALGGADAIIVNNVAGTDVSQVDIDLSGSIGGSAGDGQADVVTANGGNSSESVTITGAGTSFAVAGLAAAINVTNAEGANDSLVINGLGAIDTIVATTLAAGIVKLTLDGGDGNDIIRASQGADTILGGIGDDEVLGDNGNDVAFLGAGNDVFQWDPGDGNDVIEGQADVDQLNFFGSNASETINLVANGGRALFTRDVANVTMDLDDVEHITFRALGGLDNIIVGDLTGTDVSQVDLRLGASGGGGDGAVDTATVNGTNALDTVTVSSAAGVVAVSGLPAVVSLFDVEGPNDRLILNGLGGDDIINATALQTGLVALTVNGGLGADLITGSAGNDLVNGGDGNDTAFLGGGDDRFVWNPGDDNDVVEGQGGLDTLQFSGANVAENITISANGGRATFFRDVASVLMDLDDVERIDFVALGGADTITIGDLTGTDLLQFRLDLSSSGGVGGGDGQSDSVILNGSATANTINLSGASASLSVTGLPWTVTLGPVETNDRVTVNGGDGNDSISATGLVNGTAILTLDGGSGNDVLRSSGDGIYLGGIGDDVIFAGLTNASEVIDGGDGVDTLDTTTWGGPYIINMVTGVTNYSGESFVNFENLITGAGNDGITGTAVANIIRTGAGLDNIAGSGGNDTLEGGADADTLDGGADIDTLDYTSSDAGVTVSLATNSASGGHATGDSIANFENVTGSGFVDNLGGNGQANILNGGGGADLLAGAGGDDFYFVDNAGDLVTEGAGGGTDRIFASLSYTLAAALSVETLSTASNGGTGAIDFTGNELGNTLIGNAGVNTLAGAAGNDVLDGAAGNDALYGGTNNDVLYGRLGNDTLYGGSGVNHLDGGGGDDQYVIENGTDTVVELVGEGNDRIFAGVGYVLTAAASVETLSTSDNAGTNAINLTGNELANTILGNAGVNALTGGGGDDVLDGKEGNDTLAGGANNDILYGRAGNDMLFGGAGTNQLLGGTGDDQYVVESGTDIVMEAAGEGNDRIFASASFILAAGASVEILSTDFNAGTNALNLTGNELANTIIGNAGANMLTGGAGGDALDGKEGNDVLNGGADNDSLSGGAGNDQLVGGTGVDALAGGIGDDLFFVDTAVDTVIELAGEGVDRIFSSVSYALAGGASVEILSTDFNAGTAAINLFGNELANTLFGNDGANILNGGNGSDVLDGKSGADTYAFNNALGAGNVDTLIGFVSGVDRISLENGIFTGLAAGALPTGAFVIGAGAADATDRIIYNNATGALSFDVDGIGGAAAVQFATLSGAPALAASDFVIV
ncbi:MAG TPA: hypothetical protein VMG08_19180 [Allosphingosinicella sp.]|nr:hypothetical protein [Allosphingosinicella sp.]